MSAVPPTLYEPPPASRPGGYGAAAARGFDLPAFLRRWSLWILAAAGLLAWWAWTRPAGLAAEGPIDWTAEPLQDDAAAGEPFTLATRKGTVTLHPRARYEAAAVVAGAERYRFDATAFLSPVDLVLTWGELPREPYEGEVSYGQMTRYYFWRTAAPLDLAYIAEHSANTHLIPANANLRRAVLAVDEGDEVRLRGRLVDAVAENGLTWKTSKTRKDTGPGACELLYVEEVQVGGRIYR